MMNGKRLSLITMLFICIANIYAQQNSPIISGRILDGNKEPLESVTLLLLNANDSAYITGSITKQTGDFMIQDVKSGSYLLEISTMGYSRKYVNIIITSPDNKVDIGSIVLDEDSYQMQEVIITAKQKTVELEAGKTVVNLSSSILGSQGSVFDALKKLPGVIVKDDGSVYLNGQAGVNVLIDDKLTYLSGENLASLLRSLPATSVDKIELISHPSSKYDAAGNSGMINIQTKKVKLQGINISGSSGLEQGKYTRGYENLFLTFRKDKINIYADYTFYWGDDFNNISSLRTYLDPLNFEPIGLDLDMSAYRKYRYRSHFMRLGTDYDVSDKITVGAYLTSNWYKIRKEETTTSDFISINQSVDSTLTTYNNENRHHTNFTTGSNIVYKWSDKGKWDASFDFQHFDHSTDLAQQSRFKVPSRPLEKDTLEGGVDGKINIYAGQTNLNYKFSENWNLSLGAKTVFVSIDNTALYRNRLDNNWIDNKGLSSDFTYDENINAGYIQLQSKWTSKFSTELGLRLENTYVKGSQQTMLTEKDSSFSQNYTHLFPTLMVQYQLSENNNFSFVYGRRIIRPNYRDLNPFVEVNDRFLNERGNTELKPELTHNIELSWFLKKQYGISLFYSYRKNPITKSYLVEDDNLIVVTPLNLSSNYATGLRIGLNNLTPVNWWTLHLNASCVYKRFSWENIGNISENKLLTPMIHMNNQFTIPNGWSAEVTGYFNGSMVEGQARVHSIWNVSAGIRKKLLKDKASLYIYANDIFLSNQQHFDLRSSLQEGWYKERRDTRMIGVSFTYRFNSGSVTKDSRRNVMIDESKRINL